MEKVKKKSGAFSFFMRCIVPLFLTCYWTIAYGVAAGMAFHIVFVYPLIFFIAKNRGWQGFRGFLHIITFIGFLCVVGFNGFWLSVFCIILYSFGVFLLYAFANHKDFLSGKGWHTSSADAWHIMHNDDNSN